MIETVGVLRTVILDVLSRELEGVEGPDEPVPPALLPHPVAITASPAGAQNLPTFTFGSTSPVFISGAAAGAATLTISTTSATRASQFDPKRPEESPWHAVGGATLAFILLIGLPERRRRWQKILGTLLPLMAFTGGLLACSGGGGGSTGTGTGGVGNSGTTAGTYTVTVTGTSGVAVSTSTLTLIVQ